MRLRLRVRLVVMTAVLSVLLLAGGGLLAQESEELAEQIEELEATTRAMRNLPELVDMERQFPTRDEMVVYLTELIGRDLDDETVWREMHFYVAFDFLPADTDLRQVYIDLYSAQVAGLYDSETQMMHVLLLSGKELGDSLPLLEQITYVHEYVHALQDQHFDLESLGIDVETDRDNIDALLGVLGLIEGDATFVMNQFTTELVQEDPLKAGLQIVFQGVEAGGLSFPAGTPDILEAELLYPYTAGAKFVGTLYKAGGWRRVDAAYTDQLPQSSEHILHPELYLSEESPLVVTLTDETALGDNWEPILDRTLGEFYLRQYLLTQLPRNEAKQAAAGWGGDRYHLYYNAETDQRAWVLKIVWDTTDDAEEFAEVYQTFSETRFPFEDLAGDCAVGDLDAMCTLTEGDTTIIAIAPDVDVARILFDAQR
jgi:hypothetical protein